jgi:ribosomal protein L20A (L18A)
MTKQAWQVEGDFQMGRVRQAYRIQVVALDEAAAREQTYAEMGSRHGVKRREVVINKVGRLAAADETPITHKRLQ